ncbi:MAG: hypothetical protein UZ17_ACD001001676 [Acidobacteria bacterium OLB17]|nr:MAG: hypothetical protein UZ17_ACD001001676 [Acidobacteria bacterium OLB17]
MRLNRNMSFQSAARMQEFIPFYFRSTGLRNQGNLLHLAFVDVEVRVNLLDVVVVIEGVV